MKKKIRAYFFALLCFISSCEIQATSPVTKPFTFYLQEIKKMIIENPQLSITIVAVISLMGFAKLLFSYTKKRIIYDHPPKIEIQYAVGKNNHTLILTPSHKVEGLCYEKLHNCELSSSGKYILWSQLQNLSSFSAVRQILFSGHDISEAIKKIIRCFSLYHVIDTATGDVILSLSGTQQCDFSPDEKYLLVRQVKPIGIMKKITMLYYKTVGPEIQKDRTCIQYKVIDLATKKTIITFDNICSAIFHDDNTLVITKPDKSTEYLSPEKKVTINPFACQVEYRKISESTDCLHKNFFIDFYFDNGSKTYCLDINYSKHTQTISHVKTYHLRGKDYLLVNTDNIEHQELVKAVSDQVSVSSFLRDNDGITKIVSTVTQPQFEAQLIDLRTKTFLENNLFNYKNPAMCFITQDTIFIGERKEDNSIAYKFFDFNTCATSVYETGKAIIICNSNLCVVIDSDSNICSPTNLGIFNSIRARSRQTQHALEASHDNFDQIVEVAEKAIVEAAQDLNVGIAHAKEEMEIFTQELQANVEEVKEKLQEQTEELAKDVKDAGKKAKKFFQGFTSFFRSDPFDQIPYKNYMYPTYNYTTNEKPLLCGSGIYGLMITYNKNIFQQQLRYICNHLRENNNTIISLFMHHSKNNEAKSLNIITNEFQDNQCLLLPVEEKQYLIIEKMKKYKKQLVIFSGQKNTEKTFSLDCANKNLFDFCFTTKEEYKRLKPSIKILNEKLLQ